MMKILLVVWWEKPVNENWSAYCVKEMRAQAENVSRPLHLCCWWRKKLAGLSLKDHWPRLQKNKFRNLYQETNSVNVDAEDVEVARIMQKYDLEAIPAVDAMGRLVGRITYWWYYWCDQGWSG
jgi:magnesium transporter